MQWVPVRLAVPVFDERVLFVTSKRIELGARVAMDEQSFGQLLLGGLNKKPASIAYVWESEGGASHYEPRAVTHWMPLPARP